VECPTQMSERSNNKMRRTRRGPNGASPLILVGGVHLINAADEVQASRWWTSQLILVFGGPCGVRT